MSYDNPVMLKEQNEEEIELKEWLESLDYVLCHSERRH